LARAFPNESVLKFALATIAPKEPANDLAAQYMQSFAFNAIAASPLAVPVAMGILATLEAKGFTVNSSTIEEALTAQLTRSVASRHANEAAWALWAALAFDIKLK